MNRTVVLKFDTRIIIIAGALLVMIAVALPWANLPSFVAGDLARGGVTGGGLITLGLAMLALLSLLLPWHPWNRVSLPAAIAGALVHLVALSVFVRIVQLGGNLGLELRAQPGSIGSGLFLTFAGALLMLVGGLAGATPSTSLASLTVSNRSWQGYAVWLALATALLASCLCAWGLGWLARSYTLAASGQSDISPTFAPAPMADLATPLVGVHLLPLGSVTAMPVSSASATLIRPTQQIRATLTSSVATPTALAGVAPTTQSSPTPLLSPTLPVIGAPTATRTATPTPSYTPTSTSTPSTSPLETPTVSVTPTHTATATATTTATSTVTPTP